MRSRESSYRPYYSNPTYTYRPGQLPTPVVLSDGDGGGVSSINLMTNSNALAAFGQEAPSSDSGAGKIVFGLMLLGMGLSLGFALGVNQGVRVSKG